MNWIKTQKRRFKEEFLQAVGAHARTEDPDFDTRVQQFHQLDEDLHHVYEHMQVYFDCVNTVCAAGVALAESLVAFYDHVDVLTPPSKQVKSPLEDLAKLFLHLNQDINTIVKPSMHSAYTDRVLRPTAATLTSLPDIDEKIEKRKQMLLDFDSYRSRLSTEAAKDPNSVATQKLEFKLEQAAMNLNNITSEISNRIVEIEQSRPTMLAAEFASIVACSHHQFSQMSLLLEKMLPLLPQSGATLCLLSYYSDKSKARSQAAADLSRGTIRPFVPAPVTKPTAALTAVDVLQGTTNSSPTAFQQNQPQLQPPQPQQPSYAPPQPPLMGQPRPVGIYPTNPGFKPSLPPQPVSAAFSTDGSPSPSANPPPPPAKPRSLSSWQPPAPTDAAAVRLPTTHPTRITSGQYTSTYHHAGADAAYALESHEEETNRPSLSWSPSTGAAAVAALGIPREVNSTPHHSSSPETTEAGRPLGVRALASRFGGAPGTRAQSAAIRPSYAPPPPRPPPPAAPAPATAGPGGLVPPPLLSTVASPTAAAARKTTQKTCTAQYTFTSTQPGDLTFQAGEVITVISEDASGWWTGKIGDRQGVFPINHVKMDSA